jgi:hypothetical protein
MERGTDHAGGDASQDLFRKHAGFGGLVASAMGGNSVTVHGARERELQGPRGVAPAKADVSRIDDDLYAILSAKHRLGFVQRVGNVFVALSGKTYSHAVEVGQSLVFDDSVAMVRRSSPST